METPVSPIAFLRAPPRPRHGRSRVLVAAAALGAIWLALVYTSWLQYESARVQGEVAAVYLAREVEDWTTGAITRAEALMDAVETTLQAPDQAGDLEATIARHQAAHPRVLERVDVLAVDGRVLATSAAPRASTDATPHVATVLDVAEAMTLLGAVEQIDGESWIPLRRVVVNRDGQPFAIIRVAVRPERLAGLDGGIALPLGASIALLRRDGEILAASTTFRRHAAEDGLLDPVRLPRAGVGLVQGLDGQMRLVAHRASGDAPASAPDLGDPGLVFVAALEEAEVFGGADWRTLLLGLVATLVSGLVLTIGGHLMRERTQRATADRDLTIAAGVLGALDASIAVVERPPETTDRVVAINPAFTALLGRPADAILGKSWRDVVGDNGVAWLDEVGRPIETRYAQPDGAERWLEIRIAAIAAADAHARLSVVAVRDITQRKQTEIAMLRAKNQAEIANRAKSDFLANMSHELRTPLNAILGFSEIISKQLLGPVGTTAYREYANDIWSSGSHLLNIISDILDFAKIEAATLKLEESDVDMARLVGTCVRFMAARSAQADVTVEVDIPEDFPLVVADDLRLKQIVLNLLSNAVKFSAAGSTVTLSTRIAADGQIELRVADAGCGMTAAEVEAALQPFRQIESTMVKRAEGTGLGLPLAKRLVELHEGVLLIDSAPQRGTIVTVRLPAGRQRPRRAAA